jgi:hypothetical protein
MKCHLVLFTIVIVVLSLFNCFDVSKNKIFSSNKADSSFTKHFENNEVYFLKNVKSGKCLTVSGDGVKQITCNPYDINQSWKYEINVRNNKWFTLQNGNGKLLDNRGGSMDKGTYYQSYERNWTPAQNFKVKKAGDNWVIINQRSKMCLDIFGGSMNDGANLIHWSCHEKENQQFIFEKISNLVAKLYEKNGLVFNQWVSIKGVDSQKCLSNSKGEIAQFSCNGNDTSQRWMLKVQKGSPFLTVVHYNGKTLDNINGEKRKGTTYRTFDINNTPAQNFIFKKSPLGQWNIVNQASDLCLDMKESNKNDQGQLIQWQCGETQKNQNWIVQRIVLRTNRLALRMVGAGKDQPKKNKKRFIEGLPPKSFVTIKSQHSEKCLSNAEENIKQFSCNTKDKSQLWKIKVHPKFGAPWVIIKNYNGKFLENIDGSVEKKTLFSTKDRNDSEAQTFLMKKTEKGNWSFENQKSKFCLDVLDWNKNDGGDIIQWDCLTNQANQNYIIEKVTIETPSDNKNEEASRTSGVRDTLVSQADRKIHHHQEGELDNGFFQIRNHEDQCLQDTGIGLPLQFAKCDDIKDGFFFQFKKGHKGMGYHIISAKGNSVAHKSGKLFSLSLKHQKTQKFKIVEKNGDGIFKIKTLKKKRCLSIKDGISLKKCKKGSKNQRFIFYAYNKVFAKK